MEKKPLVKIVGGITIALCIGVALFVLTFVRTMIEQSQWYPRDEKRLQVIYSEWSEEGVVLTVSAPGGIESVWRQRINYVPLLRQHSRVPFETISRGSETKVLVDYPFKPGAEWLLALHSKDGFWVSMSPYSPDRPDLSLDQWELLHASVTNEGETR